MHGLKMQVEITLIEELLGTTPGQPELVATHLAKKSGFDPQREELEAAARGGELSTAIEAEEQRGTTFFPKTPEGLPFVYDYQIKGFFKDACGSLQRAKIKAPKAKKGEEQAPDQSSGFRSEGLRAYKKEIDGLIFVKPRQILLAIPDGMAMGVCERPLRAPTPQGERVALVRSETAPAGTTLRFEVNLLRDNLDKLVLEWLEYGELRGLGQWRNSGKGRFTYRVE